MAIQERLYSFTKRHRRKIVTLGVTLTLGAASCGEVGNLDTGSASDLTIQSLEESNNKTSVPAPKPVYNTEELLQAGCPNKSIGIRNDYLQLMDDPKKLCLGAVRISVDPYTFYKSPKTEQTIKKAKELGYTVLCTLVTHAPTKDEVELAIRVAKECDIEQVGNEVDNKKILFWRESEDYKRLKNEGADSNTLNEIILDEFTDHFVNIYQAIRKEKPKMQLILGANVDVGLTIRALQMLSKKGIPLDDIYIAAHVYNTTDDVKQRIGFLAQHFNTGKIVVTEVGAKNEDKRKLVEMLKTIKQIDRRIRIYIHELSDEEKGFGCRDIKQPELDEKCLPIREFAINDLRQNPEHGTSIKKYFR